MPPVRIQKVDERESAWEDDEPRFRVYLHGSGASSTQGWTDTYDITGADILQVIDWAQRQAGESLTYAVALVRDEGGPGPNPERPSPGQDRGLVWLVGMDGNDTPLTAQARRTQERMLRRRRDPVRVSPADAMPPDVSPA